MLSRLLQIGQRAGPLAFRATTCKTPQQAQIIISKRWSGHNTLEPREGAHDYLLFKDMFIYYAILCGIPVTLVIFYINTRANAELTDIPEGYEPRHWEYFRHPITRFMAKWMYIPPETEFEMLLSRESTKQQNLLFSQITSRVDKVMSFYNDHRSKYFLPVHAEYTRIDRDQAFYFGNTGIAFDNRAYEAVYDPDRKFVPAEGFRVRID